jgi:hypothetical protein
MNKPHHNLELLLLQRPSFLMLQCLQKAIQLLLQHLALVSKMLVPLTHAYFFYPHDKVLYRLKQNSATQTSSALSCTWNEIMKIFPQNKKIITILRDILFPVVISLQAFQPKFCVTKSPTTKK